MLDFDSLSREDLIQLIRDLYRQIEEWRKQNEELRRKDKRSRSTFFQGQSKEPS